MASGSEGAGGRRGAKLAAALLLGTSLALLVVCGELVRRLRAGGGDGTSGEDVDAAVIERLAGAALAFQDSHPDPGVGHVSLSAYDGVHDGVPVRTNALGMREREHALVKPAGVVRVILLGDSYVFGLGVREEDRVGARLERLLEEQSGLAPERIECLSFGVNSWNIVAACTFLRRFLDDLRPDLVVHVTVANDLDDGSGVRGFGALARFDPASAGHADGVVFLGHPQDIAGGYATNLLTYGLDWESNRRYDAAGRNMAALADHVAELGGKYLAVVNWERLGAVAAPRFAVHLAPEQLAFVGTEFAWDPSVCVAEKDRHWNGTGAERIARMVYGLCVERGLLPALELAPWDAATLEVERIHRAAEAEVAELRGPEMQRHLERIPTELDLATVSPEEAFLLHGGIDAQGRTSPYAALILRRGAGRRLVLEAQALPATVLAGAEVVVGVDELDLATLVLEPGAALRVERDLPDALLEREFLTIRLESEDWVYAADDPRHCVVLRLRRVALVP